MYAKIFLCAKPVKQAFLQRKVAFQHHKAHFYFHKSFVFFYEFLIVAAR